MMKHKKAVINYSDSDIALKKTRIVTIAQPIIQTDEKGEEQFYGGILWESNLIDTFKNTIIPKSFTTKRYPFIQFRRPDYPYMCQGSKSLEEVRKHSDDYNSDY